MQEINIFISMKNFQRYIIVFSVKFCQESSVISVHFTTLSADSATGEGEIWEFAD